MDQRRPVGLPSTAFPASGDLGLTSSSELRCETRICSFRGISRGIPSPDGGTDRDLAESGGTCGCRTRERARAASGRASGRRRPGTAQARDERRATPTTIPRAELERAARRARGGARRRLPASGSPPPAPGIAADLDRAFNELADRREAFSKEVARVGRAIGREGRLTERADAPALAGHWADDDDALNTLIDDLVRPTTEVARVIDAVADGDLSQKMELEIEGQPVKGEFRRIGTTVNAMVDQLSSFADEVTRVAREVGTDGKLGGQAKVKGVCGVWKDLTDNVNTLAVEPDDAGAQHRRR